MNRSTNMEHVRQLQRMANESWRGSPEFAALIAAIVSLSTPEPDSDEVWLLDPRTVESKAQWDAVARALGADVDDPDAVLAAAKAKQASVPVGVAELVERMRQAPARLWMADLVGQKISVERMRDILTFALAQQPAAEGAEGVEAALQNWLDWCNEHHEEPEARSGARIAIEALAQQPAYDEGFTAADMMDARQEGRKEAQQSAGFSAGDMSDASAQGFRAGVESVQQSAAVDCSLPSEAPVDEAMVARFLEAYRDTPGDEAIDADDKVARRWLTAALAGQQGGE